MESSLVFVMFALIIAAIIGLLLFGLKVSLWLILKAWKPLPTPRKGKRGSMRI